MQQQQQRSVPLPKANKWIVFHGYWTIGLLVIKVFVMAGFIATWIWMCTFKCPCESSSDTCQELDAQANRKTQFDPIPRSTIALYSACMVCLSVAFGVHVIGLCHGPPSANVYMIPPASSNVVVPIHPNADQQPEEEPTMEFTPSASPRSSSVSA
jgi:hypothetical protein